MANAPSVAVGAWTRSPRRCRVPAACRGPVRQSPRGTTPSPRQTGGRQDHPEQRDPETGCRLAQATTRRVRTTRDEASSPRCLSQSPAATLCRCCRRAVSRPPARPAWRRPALVGVRRPESPRSASDSPRARRSMTPRREVAADRGLQQPYLHGPPTWPCERVRSQGDVGEVSAARTKRLRLPSHRATATAQRRCGTTRQHRRSRRPGRRLGGRYRTMPPTSCGGRYCAVRSRPRDRVNHGAGAHQ